MSSSIQQICRQITQPIFFITPDINWAIGLETLLPNYHIICWEHHPIVDLVAKNCPVLCLQRDLPDINVAKNTGSILALPEIQQYILKQSHGQQPAIMYFKPSPKIDKLCDELKYLQIGNRSDLSHRFEDKVNLLELGKQHPELQVIPGIVANLQELTMEMKPHPVLLLQGEGIQARNLKRQAVKLPLTPSSSEEGEFPLLIGEGQGEVQREQDQGWIIQLSRGWAGRSTYLITNEQELTHLKKQTGDQVVKITPYLSGQTYINNACVLPDGTVLQSPPAQQITCPHPEFSSLPFATCGRQWDPNHRNVRPVVSEPYPEPVEGVGPSYVSIIERITQQVGKLLHQSGYLGYFGLDFLIEDETNQVFLLEINPRLTASSSFYTQLELRANLPPLLLFHLLSFLPDRSNLISQLTKRRNDETTKRNLSGIQLLLRNSHPKPITIRITFPTGTYRSNDISSTGFLKPTYRIDELQSDQLLLKIHSNVEISPESEILTIESLEPLLANHQLPESIINQLLKLKQSLLES